MQPRDDLRAEGDRDLGERILAEPAIQSAIDRIRREAKEPAARRHLLATSTRLTAEMAPEVHAIVDSCLTTLGVDGQLELFVYPGARFNAAAVKPERGRLLMMVSSSLLEAFNAPELRFVIGHEVGHFLFDHHGIPTGALLGGAFGMRAELALMLFAWQRYAELSADRAGLVCAAGLEPSARALFKIASGIGSDRVEIRIDQFLAQMTDLRQEVESFDRLSESARGDWFASHPFSPLRLKAVELCAQSEVLTAGGMTREQLELQVQELMTLMDPSYLTARTDVAETMRRLLFAAGVAIAASSGRVEAAAVEALERLLGPGSIPRELKAEVIVADLPRRVEAVRADVPVLRRAQVLRDLCVIARADGAVDGPEIEIIRDLATQLDVDVQALECVFTPAAGECAVAPACPG